MRNDKRLVALMFVLGLVSACDSDKQPAQAAFARVEASVDPVRADLEMYAPDEFVELNSAMDAMKARLNAKDYAGALALQSQVMGKLLVASMAAGKNKNTKLRKLASDWREFAVAVPAMLAQLNSHATVLANANRLPTGVSRDVVRTVLATLPELTAAWGAAVDASRHNDVTTAVNRAQAVKKRCLEMAASIGLHVG